MGREGRSGRTLSNYERNMILRVLAYFEDEKRHKNPILPVERAFERASVATGVAVRTIRRIRNEAKKITETTPATSIDNVRKEIIFPKKPRNLDKKLKVDDAMLESIREIINNIKSRQEEPTIRKIFAAAKELGFPGQKESLRKIINERLGYRFKNYFPNMKGKPKGGSKKRKPQEMPKILCMPMENMSTMSSMHNMNNATLASNSMFSQLVENYTHSSMPSNS